MINTLLGKSAYLCVSVGCFGDEVLGSTGEERGIVKEPGRVSQDRSGSVLLTVAFKDPSYLSTLSCFDLLPLSLLSLRSSVLIPLATFSSLKARPSPLELLSQQFLLTSSSLIFLPR